MADKSTTLKTRFIVERCTEIRRRGREPYALIFLTPLLPSLENTPLDEGDPVGTVLWEAEINATPFDFSFTEQQTDQPPPGYGPSELGIEISLASPLETGTILDLELHIIGKRLEPAISERGERS